MVAIPKLTDLERVVTHVGIGIVSNSNLKFSDLTIGKLKIK
jgi:hypothetical protein